MALIHFSQLIENVYGQRSLMPLRSLMGAIKLLSGTFQKRNASQKVSHCPQ